MKKKYNSTDSIPHRAGRFASQLESQRRNAVVRQMLASIEGTCVFTPEQVKKRMDIVQGKVDELSKEIEVLQMDMSEAKTISSEILEQHQQLLSWAELFDSASIDEKKVIASQMIKAVTLTRNYGIQIEFNISEAQFLNGMEMG